jgi:hypothetical protein
MTNAPTKKANWWAITLLCNDAKMMALFLFQQSEKFLRKQKMPTDHPSKITRRKIVLIVLITGALGLVIPYLLGELTTSNLETWIPTTIGIIIISLIFVFALPKLMEEQMKDLEDQARRDGRS